MRRSALIFSGLLHVGVFALAVIGLPWLPERNLELIPPVIEVELAQIAKKTNPPPPAPKPVEKKPEERPAPPKPEPARVAPPPPPPPPPEPEPEPEPAKVVEAPPPPEPVPAPEPKQEPPKVAEAPPPPPQPAPKPRARPRPPAPPAPAQKQEPESKPLDLAKLSALINKMQQAAVPAPQTEQPPEPSAAEPAPPSQMPSTSEPLTISELDAIRQQFERCWSPPAGARDAANLLIRIRISLNPDGSLRSTPELMDRSRMSDEFWRAAAESAQRAVYRCAPLQNLPASKYERWRDIELTFNPKEMLG